MPTIIDRLVVKAEFQGIGALLSKFQEMSVLFARQQARMGNYVTDLQAYAGGLGKLMTTPLFKGFLIATVVQGFFSTTKAIFNATREMQNFELQLRALYGSAEKGRQALAWIQRFDLESPFDIKETISAFQTLANFGIQPTARLLRDLGGMARQSGRSFRDMTLALAQGAMGNFRRLQYFGINRQVVDQQARAMYHLGYAALDFQKRVEVIDAVVHRRWGNTFAVFQNGLENSISNLRSAWQQLLAEFGKGTENPAAFLIRGLTWALRQLRIGVADTRTEWQTMAAAVAETFAKLSSGFGLFKNPMSRYFDAQAKATMKEADLSRKHADNLKNPKLGEPPIIPNQGNMPLGGANGAGNLARQLIGPRGVVAQIGANATEIAGLSRTRQQRTVTVRVETDQGSPWGRAMEELFNRFLYQAARQGAI